MIFRNSEWSGPVLDSTAAYCLWSDGGRRIRRNGGARSVGPMGEEESKALIAD